MERPRNPAYPSLMSRFNPAANCSCPRPDPAVDPRRTASASRSGRSSLGSEASAPGLVDDRTDSEFSVDDDDYQHHPLTAELWDILDSFWHLESQAEMNDESLLHARKQYSSLIPSPLSPGRRQPAVVDGNAAAAPLLPDAHPHERNRQPAAAFVASASSKTQPSYTAFPKRTTLPPRTTSMLPIPASCVKSNPKPSRPPRPSDELLELCVRRVTPCGRQSMTAAASLAASDYLLTGDNPPPPPPKLSRRPSSPVVWRPSRGIDGEAVGSVGARTPGYPVASRSSTHLPLSQTQPLTARVPRPCKSMAHLPPPLPAPPRPAPQPEPHSVFEDDSDSDEDNGRSFFRFHRRSDGDSRRSAKTLASGAASIARRRTFASLSPLSPVGQQQPEPGRRKKTETSGRKRGKHDVLGRMLGRRSR